MGEYLKRIDDDTAKAMSKAEADLARLTKTKEWEAAKTAADLAGIVDPSPAADSISIAMSIAEKDWVGAFLSGVCYIPYAGDALAKPVKLIRTANALPVQNHLISLEPKYPPLALGKVKKVIRGGLRKQTQKYL
jgi:hypothetical protein